ncbi:amidohydrolase [Limibaculum sp. M0105]|uniref:Amidohydrolase n=1 Tax=Thermohalobaculum xanthum TaxID=2753746 RepID=A0A8J7M8L8_9RHOB|nr:M20 aminoacylase family protein [Thermohalobaculum xanthum]MBK0400225.1 amidohydrolase [Thermohalobaculum xanthum]
MPIVNRFADLHPEITEWRRDIHAHPELMFDVQRTAGIVAEKLRAFGCDEVAEGIGRTGVVGLIRGRETGSGRVVGLRADMDALPIMEATGLPHASTIPGKMHACGHDGHTAMLLGAAKYLADTRNFDGAVAVIFQPAEEGGGGGREMVNDGMLDRFGVQQVFGMHNMPGLPVGQFAIRPGPLMAAADHVEIEIEGLGGHAARPHCCIDTTLVAAHMMTALQSVVARTVDPLESAVVSICSLHTAGDAFNVIPQTVTLKGTVRTLSRQVQDQVEERIATIVDHTARAFGAQARLEYRRNYPVTVNTGAEAAFAADVAASVAGEGQVDREVAPLMGAEDFSFMLEARPGAMIFTGNGDTAGVHHPAYDFNDEVIPVGCSYWAKLVETAMPVR